MGHCDNGAGPNTVEGDTLPVGPTFPPGIARLALDPLEQWVEHGIAPDQIVAYHVTNGVNDFSRPVCPYPALPRYRGVGDPTKAGSFVCVADGDRDDNQPPARSTSTMAIITRSSQLTTATATMTTADSVTRGAGAEGPEVARSGRRAPNRGNVVEDPLWNRIADGGNPGCQGQVATQLSRSGRVLRTAGMGHGPSSHLRETMVGNGVESRPRTG